MCDSNETSVCEVCGHSPVTSDGLCKVCYRRRKRSQQARAHRSVMVAVYGSCNMRKVRGNLGGTYYE